uniref:Ent-kaurene oxidase n=1 Tax=Anthurium amnicola TaxID=1678845 RepID=A0A1D1Y8D8_9ARAE
MIEISTFQLFVIFIIVLYIIKRPRIGVNEPPLVPYTIPILGHTYNYLFNTNKFVKKCKEQYGECFSIYVFGRVITIVSRNSLLEVFKNADHFDLISATNESLPLHKLLIYNGGIDREKIKFHAKTAREQVSGKLDVNINIVQKSLSKGIDKWIGDCNDPKIVYNAWLMVNNIISLPISNIFVGEEAASHEDLVKSLGNLAFDLSPLLIMPPILSFIHQKLHEFVITLPMRFGWNPVSHHRKVVLNRLRPVVEKRLKERNGENYKPYNDLIEYYMNQPDFDYSKPDNLPFYVDNLFVMSFTAIHTTSKAASNALYDLAGRPELLNELYEEALTINKECNGSLTVSDIKKMKKLDSFVKESLRLSSDLVELPHYMISESYTFSNGFTIPGGRIVNLYTSDLLTSKEAFGVDAKEFKPYRFVDTTNSSATKVDRSYIVFGGGKHACPGRYFAVNETKLFLHKVILKYKISTKSGKVENKLSYGPATLPPQSGLVFENRGKNSF